MIKWIATLVLVATLTACASPEIIGDGGIGGTGAKTEEPLI